MFNIIATNGTQSVIGTTDTMFQVRQDGTIVTGHFDDTTNPIGTTRRTWVIPGIHTEITIRIPSQPSHSAKAAIVFLMDELFSVE